MSNWNEKIRLIAVDTVTIHAAFFLWLSLRNSLGFFAGSSVAEMGMATLLIACGWILWFAFFGMYRNWYAASRTDEMIDLVKAISVGILALFAATFDLKRDLPYPFRLSRLTVLAYWALMVAIVGAGRMALHTVQRKLIEQGIGRHKALIVGVGKKAGDLYRRLVQAPALGLDVVGFVNTETRKTPRRRCGIPVYRGMDPLIRLVRQGDIQEVLVALPRRSEKRLESLVARLDGLPVGLKVVPELYDVLVGRVRTNQIYGFPLVEILPHPIAPWERVVKRTGDVLFSVLVLVGLLPLWLVLLALIKIDSPGPVFYQQERVGKDGRIFHIIKFRSMVRDAEKMTGPVWASGNDPRVTAVGRWIRKLRLDEIPQLVNVLKGDMSLVGPRPERPFFVQKLKRVYPLYTKRLHVRPGITGWAQVRSTYDETLEDVRRKLEYDLFYMENMSLRMDLKILLMTVYVVLSGRGH